MIIKLNKDLTSKNAQVLITFEGGRIDVVFGGNYHMVNAARLQRLPQAILRAVRKQFLTDKREKSDAA